MEVVSENKSILAKFKQKQGKVKYILMLPDCFFSRWLNTNVKIVKKTLRKMPLPIKKEFAKFV